MSHTSSAHGAAERPATGRARPGIGRPVALPPLAPAGERPAPGGAEAALRFQSFSYAYPGAADWTLRDADLQITPGQCLCLTGPTGSGKTTLALAARDLLAEGRRCGRIEVAGGCPSAVGVVLENPDLQILTDTVATEVAFGLENRGVVPHAMPERVEAALAAVGLSKPLDFPTAHLSMGQKYRLLVAAQLVLDPAVLILDEPVAQLDHDGLMSLASIIDEMKARGVAVLLCEHRPEALARVIDGYRQLDADGRLLPGRSVRSTLVAFASAPATRPSTAAPVVRTRELSLHPADATPAWDKASVEIAPGERVALCAPNGTGKTSMLRCLAGFVTPAQGRVEVLGETPSPQRLRGRLGYLAQNPERQLFEDTVFDEVAFALRRFGRPPAAVTDSVERMLARLGLGALAACSPHLLSYGQKRLVALASVVAAEPALLLLDDPFAGLDADRARAVAELLVECSERRQTSVVWTSHDDCATVRWAHTAWTIQGGSLVVR